MYIPTEDKLFEHKCQFKDMKLSAFNPKSLTYYCQICGGKFIIEKDMKDWGEIFGEPINLKLNKKVLNMVLDEREEYVKLEEQEMAEREEQARQKAEQARKKAEEIEKEKEQLRYYEMKEKTREELGVDPEKAGEQKEEESDEKETEKT